MELNEQVARRRAELAGQERQEWADERAEQQKQVAAARDERERITEAEKAQREAAVANVATQLSSAGLPVHAEGENLAFNPPDPIDIAGLQRSKVAALLDQEARRLWTPLDNRVVISSITAGIILIPLYGLGIALIIYGLIHQSNLNKRYKEELLTEYPQIREIMTAV